MAELPGWDRPRLRVAPPSDVAAARLIAYVKHWRPLLVRDLASEIADLMFATSSQGNDPKAVERYEKRQRLALLEDLKELARLQANVRERLGLGTVDA